MQRWRKAAGERLLVLRHSYFTDAIGRTKKLSPAAAKRLTALDPKTIENIEHGGNYTIEKFELYVHIMTGLDVPTFLMPFAAQDAALSAEQMVIARAYTEADRHIQAIVQTALRVEFPR